MKGVNYMVVLGLLILVIGIACTTYVKTDQVIVYSGMANHYDVYEVRTQPYFVHGLVMISIGTSLSLVWLFLWYPNAFDKTKD